MPRIGLAWWVLVLLALWVSYSQAAPLTTDQLQVLKADILASPDLANNTANPGEIAKAYNLPATPDYWAWRTQLKKYDVYSKPSPTGSNWSWTVYEGLTTAKQGTWAEIFQGQLGWTDYSLPNNRLGVEGLFGPPNVAQKNHIDAHGRRLVTRAEKLYATPPAPTGGTTANPGTMGWEGQMTAADVSKALALP